MLTFCAFQACRPRFSHEVWQDEVCFRWLVREMQVVLVFMDLLIARYNGRLAGCVDLWDLSQNAGIGVEAQLPRP
jgi:hypothetical protein